MEAGIRINAYVSQRAWIVKFIVACIENIDQPMCSFLSLQNNASWGVGQSINNANFVGKENCNFNLNTRDNDNLLPLEFIDVNMDVSDVRDPLLDLLQNAREEAMGIYDLHFI